MPQAMGAHERQRRIEIAPAQRLGLRQRAGLQHRLEAHIDAPLQLVALGFEKNRPRGGDVEQGRGPRALERGEAPPRRLQNLERAQDPLRIARAQPRRHQGIATARVRREARRRECSRPVRATAARTSSGTAGMPESPCVSALK